MNTVGTVGKSKSQKWSAATPGRGSEHGPYGGAGGVVNH